MILAFRPRHTLTPREVDVVRLVAEGLTDKQVAADLSLTCGTTRNIISNAAHKLGASNRVETILLAHNAGVLSLPECAARFAQRLEQRAA